jgi:hypothetical protein
MKAGSLVVASVLSLGLCGWSQQASSRASLTVTATVVSSVGFAIPPATAEKVGLASIPDRGRAAPVEYHFQYQGARCQVHREAVLMDVKVGGKTKREPVLMITVVPD